MNIEMIETSSIQEYSPVEAGLQELRRKYGNVAVDVTTTKALDEAKRVRAEIREPRYECEKIRKALKAPALAHAKLIDTEAARITAELLAIETPWDEAIKAEETRKEAEKAAKEQAERARITAIHERIASIRNYHTLALECRTSERINALLAKMTAVWVAFNFEDDFEEFGTEAQGVFNATQQRISELLAQKQADEAERARVKAEQEAEAARIKAAREALAAEQATAKAKADAEAAELAAARAELQRQRDQIAAERAELERTQREAREAADLAAYAAAIAEPVAPLPTLEIEPPAVEPDVEVLVADPQPDDSILLAGVLHPQKQPSALELIRAVAHHFDVGPETAAEWLTNAADEIANFE